SIAETISDWSQASRACQLAIEAVGRQRTSESHEDARIWAERVDRVAPVGTVFRAYADVMRGLFTPDWSQGTELLKKGFDLACSLDAPDVKFFAAVRSMNPRQFTPGNLPALVQIANRFWGMPKVGVSTRNLARFYLFAGTVWLASGERERW